MTEIIAKIERLENGKNVVYSFETGRDFSHLFEHDCYCDVCKKNINRNEVYVVRLDDGKEIQCGGSCLNKIIPTELSWKSQAVMNDAIVDNFGFFMKGKSYLDRNAFVAYLTQTDHNIKTLSYSDYRTDNNLPKKEDIDNLAKPVVNYFASYDGTNEFVNNIKNLVVNEYIEAKYFNIVKYANKAYKDYLNYLKTNEDNGLEDESFIIKNIWLERKYWDRTYSYHGVETYVYRMYDENNHLIEMSTSSTKDYLSMTGKKVICKIKKTYSSRNGRVTVIKNLKESIQ